MYPQTKGCHRIYSLRPVSVNYVTLAFLQDSPVNRIWHCGTLEEAVVPGYDMPAWTTSQSKDHRATGHSWRLPSTVSRDNHVFRSINIGTYVISKDQIVSNDLVLLRKQIYEILLV